MKYIIFELLLILADIWIIFKKDDSLKLSKCLALIGMILLVISITLRVLDMNGII